jgi:hypothetical protein
MVMIDMLRPDVRAIDEVKKPLFRIAKGLCSGVRDSSYAGAARRFHAVARKFFGATPQCGGTHLGVMLKLTPPQKIAVSGLSQADSGAPAR